MVLFLAENDVLIKSTKQLSKGDAISVSIKGVQEIRM